VEKSSGGLVSWAHGVRRRSRALPRRSTCGVRFAYYGRTSTVEFQDPVSSAAWQREAASV
jgi:site-specific DNA recombinase